MRSVPDEPPWCQGLLLTARDLVFGVIDFGLYYALLTRLRLSCFGGEGGIRTLAPAYASLTPCFKNTHIFFTTSSNLYFSAQAILGCFCLLENRNVFLSEHSFTGTT